MLANMSENELVCKNGEGRKNFATEEHPNISWPFVQNYVKVVFKPLSFHNCDTLLAVASDENP